MKSPEKITQHIVNWLNDYLDQSHMNGFVVGVSGGIDSAVTSTLWALTKRNVLCLEMPIHQAKDQVNRAQEHIAWLKANFPNVQAEKIDLTKVYDSFQTTLPEVHSEDIDQQQLSLANTRARFRMTTLYYFAALQRYLVAGTGNKVEDFGVGFYTKYGDGGVDLSPIADLLKTQVFTLGKHLGVSSTILTAAPTDGLWSDNRTDEDQIGATYAQLEWAMEAQEKKLNPASMTTAQQKVYRIYTKFHQANLHKMLPIPVCNIPEELL
jgi:NAD+ synthase